MFDNERTHEEKDPSSSQYLHFGRYFPSCLYLWSGSFNRPEFNDIKVCIDPEIDQYIRRSAKDQGI